MPNSYGGTAMVWLKYLHLASGKQQFADAACERNLGENRGRMNNTSPFSFLESIATRFQPPAWAVDEVQQRLVLFLNHVLQQEKQAQDRLLRQKGRIVRVLWGVFAIDLIVTPAGLVDRAVAVAKPDLLLSLAADSPLVMLQSALSGKAPPVKIEGDVQLAADVGWLAENLRWDVEEDLSRLIGDGPAHGLAKAARQLVDGLKQFLATGPLSSVASSMSSSSSTSSAWPQADAEAVMRQSAAPAEAALKEVPPVSGAAKIPENPATSPVRKAAE